MAESASNTNADPFIGRSIADKYVVESLIGGGSMGAVYKARQTALHRIVAIKVMYPELATDREFAGRFRREAHAASRLAHVNSITITDFGEEPDGLLYLVMEYVDGPSLEALIERAEPLPDDRIIDLMSQILSACAAAHDAGIVHRDLKPANVLVLEKFDDDGFPVDHVKVCDFGVASLRDVAAEGVVLRPSQDGLGAVIMIQAVEAKRQVPRPSRALTMAGRGGRDARVHVPGASERQAARRPQRSLLAGRSPLRAHHAQVAVRRAHRRRADGPPRRRGGEGPIGARSLQPQARRRVRAGHAEETGRSLSEREGDALGAPGHPDDDVGRGILVEASAIGFGAALDDAARRSTCRRSRRRTSRP